MNLLHIIKTESKSNKFTQNEELDFTPISTIKNNDFTDKNQLESGNVDVITNNICDTFFTMYHQLSTDSIVAFKEFLLLNTIWSLLDSTDINDVEIHTVLVQKYFSIPDRFSNICKHDLEKFFLPGPFQYRVQEALLEILSISTDVYSNLKRYIAAFDRLEDFGTNILVKISSFWDAIDSDLLNLLSSSNRNKFVAFLLKHVIVLNLPLKKNKLILKSIFKHISQDATLQIINSFIFNGTLKYQDFAMFLVSADCDNWILENAFNYITKTWSNNSWISRTSFSAQLHFASCLMIVFSLLSPQAFNNSPIESVLLDGIQQRFEHSDPRIRLISTCVAECLNCFHLEMEKKLDFNLDSKDEIVVHLRQCFKMTQIIFSNGHGPSSSVDIDNESLVIEENNFGAGNTDAGIESDEEDLVPISSLLKKESEPKNAKVKVPIFISDCLKVLRSNDDPSMIESVLNRFESAYKTSSRLTREMNAVSTFTALSTISDKFEIADFDQKRITTMHTVLVDQIKLISPVLISDMFHSNKLVLSQKMELMMVISESALEIFRVKSVIAPHSANKKNSDELLLNYFEDTFRAVEFSSSTTSSSSKKAETLQAAQVSDFVEYLCIPLLKQSIRHFNHLTRNHVMFLEKFLWLQGIILNFSRNSLCFDQIVSKYLDLVHLTIKSSYANAQLPVQKALFLGVSVVLTSWPDSLSVIDNYSRLQEIYALVEQLAENSLDDPQLQVLLASTVMGLQDLTNPQRLISESTNKVAFGIDSLKISADRI